MLRKNGGGSPRASDKGSYVNYTRAGTPIPPISRDNTRRRSARREMNNSRSSKSVVVPCVTSSRTSDTAGSQEPSENSGSL